MSARDEQWGPIIRHDGKGCPCVGQYVQAHYRDGRVSDFIAGLEAIECGIDPSSTPMSAWVWGDGKTLYKWPDGVLARASISGEIIRYRIRKPRALQQLVELVENLPAPQPEQVDA